MNKVFGIGLARTGTLSLNSALNILGFRSKHFPGWIREFDEFDAATDTSVTIGYKFLDVMYPDSRFILTVRDMDSWLESCRKLWEREHQHQTWQFKQLHRGLYGTHQFNPHLFRSAYERHFQEVIAHFSDWPEQLLVLNIVAGDGWEKLCAFLGRQIPEVSFPHEHNSRPVAQADIHPALT